MGEASGPRIAFQAVNEFLAQVEPASQWFGALVQLDQTSRLSGEWPFDFGNTATKSGCIEQVSNPAMSAEARSSWDANELCTRRAQIADGMQTFGRRASGTGVAL